jgi:IS30 family transposase
MAKVGSNKPQIVQAHVIELSATGMSGRKIAQQLNINRRTVARILVGPEARRLVLEARERAKRMVEKADGALHRSLDRGSSRTAIAVLRGAGVFESRAESIVRYRYQDAARAQADLERLEQKSRRDAVGKFGRTATDDRSGRIERLAFIERERAANPPEEAAPFDPSRRRRW